MGGSPRCDASTSAVVTSHKLCDSTRRNGSEWVSEATMRPSSNRCHETTGECRHVKTVMQTMTDPRVGTARRTIIGREIPPDCSQQLLEDQHPAHHHCRKLHQCIRLNGASVRPASFRDLQHQGCCMPSFQGLHRSPHQQMQRGVEQMTTSPGKASEDDSSNTWPSCNFVFVNESEW